jgi:hypothetical protein
VRANPRKERSEIRSASRYNIVSDLAPQCKGGSSVAQPFGCAGGGSRPKSKSKLEGPPHLRELGERSRAYPAAPVQLPHLWETEYHPILKETEFFSSFMSGEPSWS